MNSEPDEMSEAELAEIEHRAEQASPAPWESFIEGRNHQSGASFIRVGGRSDDPDMYVTRERIPASVEDLDFIAHAREDIPRLVAEIRRLRHVPEGGRSDD
jgi:hypothetical protein